MAWMKSKATKRFYLTGEFTSQRIDTQGEAEKVTDVLGFRASVSESTSIQDELARVARNRALLVKDIADAILPAIAAGVTVTAEVDEAAIARAVEAQLAFELEAIRDDVNRPRTVS